MHCQDSRIAAARNWLVIALALYAFDSLHADDAAIEALRPVIESQRPFDSIVRWDLLPVEGAVSYRGLESVYLVVSEAPAGGVVRFPRLHRMVRTAVFLDPGEGPLLSQPRPLHYHRDQVCELTQTPTEWSLAIPADNHFPLVVALDLVGSPLDSSEPFANTPGPDRTIVLAAHNVIVHGEKLQYEPLPYKNTVGYWVNPADWCEWSFEAPPGEYAVELLQGCGEGQGGSRVRMQIDDATIDFEVLETGHFQNFRWREMGSVTLTEQTSHQLSLKVLELANFAVMDVRKIRLVPVDALQPADREANDVVPDVILPPLFDGPPSTGRRVVHTLPEYNDAVYHTVYLPTDWRDDRTHPVLVELIGNGSYRSDRSDQFDACSGWIEDAELGIGLTGGDGWIVVGLPFLNAVGTATVTQWWGDAPDYDPAATLAYWRRAIDDVCEHHGGDRNCIVLAGFSRGSIACNYLGLHDDSVAGLWKGFICCSHYDGVVESWPYPAADRVSAIDRLRRLNGRPQFILSESSNVAGASLDAVQQYLTESGEAGQWAFATTGFRNHSDDWALRPSPARAQVREWLKELQTTSSE